MQNDRGNKAATLIAGIGLGAALMYFLDPQRGIARRKQARDRAGAALRDAKRDLENQRRDLRNRARGLVAELRKGNQEPPVDDVVLVERVRAELGHHVDSVRGVEVEADDGTVTLHGEVRARDRGEALSAAAGVPGVESVVDELNRG